jgi:hypothetical protein
MSIIYRQQTCQSKNPVLECCQVPPVSSMLAVAGVLSSNGRISYNKLKGLVNNLPNFHPLHLDFQHCTNIVQVNIPASLPMMHVVHLKSGTHLFQSHKYL